MARPKPVKWLPPLKSGHRHIKMYNRPDGVNSMNKSNGRQVREDSVKNAWQSAVNHLEGAALVEQVRCFYQGDANNFVEGEGNYTSSARLDRERRSDDLYPNEQP